MRFPKLIAFAVIFNTVVAVFALGMINASSAHRGIETRIQNGEIILRIDGDDFGMDADCARSVADALQQSADELDVQNQ